MQRYAAFISYSHADERWARWLQHAIERYRVPARIRAQAGGGRTIPSRLVPVFRDRDELASASDLTSAIQAALEESGALLVVCSPAAAASKWVNAEIRRFQSIGRSDRIFCMIVAGRSDRAAADCAFPPALLTAEDGTELPSPLAVNPDDGADGRRGALLKIIAALLDIRVDDLRRRDYQRQVRFWSAAAAGAGVVAAVTVGLAIYAQLARQEADLRRSQAEGLIGFMLGDLRQKLEPIGRLDVLDAVGDQAADYFAAVGARASDRERLSRAMALRQIGEVRRSQGKLDRAAEAFGESLQQLSLLQASDPGNERYLYELSQAEFWVGQTAYERNELDSAAAALRRYMDHSRSLLERAPANPDYGLELSYAYSNLGTLARERGRPSEALEHFRAAAELESALAAQDPGNDALRFSLAESYSWTGTTLLDLGRLDEAEASFRLGLATLEPLHRSGRNHRHSEEYADVGVMLSGALAQRGRGREAVARLGESLGVYEDLAAHDPANARWQRSRLVTLLSLLELEVAAGPVPDGGLRSRQICEAFERLAGADPDNAILQKDLALAERLEAMILAQGGETSRALSVAVRAHGRLESIGAAAGRESLRLQAVRVADTVTALLLGAGRVDEAQRRTGEALRVLESSIVEEGGLEHLALKARLLARLGRTTDAAPIIVRLREAGFADPRLPLPAVT